jgi:hypothetical protein
MPKLVAALLAVILAAALLAACGGGSGSDSTGTSTSAETASQGQREAAKEKIEAKVRELKEKRANSGSGAQSGGGNGSGGSKKAKTAIAVPPLKVSGGGSAQVRTKGGDNSIQNYGEESGESELREAAEAVHGFYVARANEEWAKACSYLTKSTTQQFEELASRSPQLKGKGCAPVLQAFTRPLPPSVERETTLVDAISLRQDGERAFLIYRGAEDKAYAISMQQEGGAWKVGSVAGTPLY